MKHQFRLREKGAYGMLQAALLACMVLFGAGRYFGIAKPGVLQVLFALSVVAALTIRKHLSAKLRLLCVFGMVGSIGSVCAVVGFAECVDFLYAYGNWLVGGSSWVQEQTGGYAMLQVLLLAVICYLLQLVLDREFRMKLGFSLLLLAVSVFCMWTEREVSQACMALTTCYLAMVLSEALERSWKKEKNRNTAAYMLWIMPFLGAYLIVLLCLPVPDKPYDWQIFKDIYTHISTSFEKLSAHVMSIGREDGELSLSGFSERGALGEGFKKDDRAIMTLRSAKGRGMNVYLTGKVFDTFEGRQWQQYQEDTSAERFLDAARTLYAVQRFDKEYQVDYVYRASLDICYQDFHTQYLFAPLKTWSLEVGDRKLPFTEEGGSLLFDGKKGYGTEYEVIYYQLNQGQECFEELLEAKLPEDEQLLWEILQKLKGRTAVELTGEDMEQHELAVYRNYLDEVSLSAEVEEYLAGVLGDAETDVEKLKAIESHLASLTYHNNPGELPDTVVDGESFLDYFLLESRQGYCSHFTTAFVLLARAEGIPARYVQGYCVPMEGKGEVTVTSDMAHAWPEVYLKDIGWIPFEPTPGYGEVRYTPWKMKKGEGVVSSAYRGSYAVTDLEAQEEEEEELTAELTGEEPADTGASDNHVGVILRILALSFATVLFVGAFLLVAERLIDRWRYRHMNAEQRYLTELRRTFRILARLGRKRRDGETLQEFFERTSEQLLLEKKLSFTEDYEAYLYGKRTVEEDMIDRVREAQAALIKLLKQKKKWTYWYWRFR